MLTSQSDYNKLNQGTNVHPSLNPSSNIFQFFGNGKKKLMFVKFFDFYMLLN